jgi:radical SAM-linked protein
MSINKEVTREYVVEIIEEAKKRGWKGAKFYFMIGLPLPEDEKKEEEEIVDFVSDIGRKTGMHLNINVGVFVPKPHTPYQFSSQINNIAIKQKLDYIRSRLKPTGHKVSVSDTVVSQIEGLLSRGDERAGLLCETAYLGGSRLDAWSEYIDKILWQNILEDNQDLIDTFLSGNLNNKPPWDVIDSYIEKKFLSEELIKSEKGKLTFQCTEKCTSCGVCGKYFNVTKNKVKYDNQTSKNFNYKSSSVNHVINGINVNQIIKQDIGVFKVLFSFNKTGSAVFHGHLSLIEIFSMAFRRLKLPVLYTQGYNPIIKIEFASSLSVGITADNEFASIFFSEEINLNNHLIELNKNLPCGIKVKKTDTYFIPVGKKKYSLSSLLWGFSYASSCGKIDYINAKLEKDYRNNCLKDYLDQKSAIINLTRNEVLARNITGSGNEWSSYFDVYRYLYPDF